MNGLHEDKVKRESNECLNVSDIYFTKVKHHLETNRIGLGW